MRKFTDDVKREFIYGGHLLSLGASSIVYSTQILLNHSFVDSLPILFFAYLSSQLVYNYDHLDEIPGKGSANKNRTAYLAAKRRFQMTLLVIYLIMFLATGIFFLNTSTTLLGLLIVLSGVLYTKHLKGVTKVILGFKNYYISLFWSSLVLFPLLYYSQRINLFYGLFMLFVFLRFIVSTVFFDFKDLQSDRKAGLKTFPAAFGISKTISFLHLVNLSSGILVVIAVKNGLFPVFSLGLLFFCLYGFYYLTKDITDRKKIHKISYVLVDGEYFLWPILLLLVNLL